MSEHQVVEQRAVLDALERAPCTAKQLAQQLGAPVKAVRSALATLVERGDVFPCVGHRFWLHDERAVLLAAARTRLERKPATRNQLVTALGRVGTGASKSYLQRLVKELREAGDIHVWPRHGQFRAERLAATPPDLDLYLSRVRTELLPVLDKLEAVGTSVGAVAGALFPELSQVSPAPGRRPPPPSEPSDEAERDFHREVSVQLVFAWEDAEGEPATREALADVMFNMGLRRLGESGMAVSFEGLKHETEEDLLPGDPAVVVEPGWELLRGTRSRVVGRAKVRAP